MKRTMRFISMAALALVGALMTSCSSEDELANNQQPAKQDNIVTVTTTISLDDGSATTRALAIDYDAKTVTKTFAVGDQVALVYKNTSEVDVKAVSQALTAEDISADGKKATLTFTLTNPQASQTVFYYYPAALVNESGSLAIPIATQNGTLDNVESLDYAYGTGLLSGTTLPASVTLENKFAIVAFTLKDATGANNITSTITGMTIVAGAENYTVTRTAAAGPIYVIIRPTSSATINITTTDGTKNYTKTLTGKTYAASNFYQQGLLMTEVSSLSQLKTAITSGTDCSSCIGWEVNSNGDIAASVSGTKIGYVAYVSTSDVDTGVSGSRILVLASADADQKVWGNGQKYVSGDGMNGYSYTKSMKDGYCASAGAAWEYSATIPNGGATPAQWFMPSRMQWECMRDTQSGADNQAKRNAMNTAFGLLSADYWSSTEIDATEAYRFSSNGETDGYYKNYAFRIRACFAY